MTGRSLSPATRARRGLLPHMPVVTLRVSGRMVGERELAGAIKRQMQRRPFSSLPDDPHRSTP